MDPVSAVVYKPNRVQLSSGETVTGTPIVVLRTRIKPPRGIYVRELENQGHADSYTDRLIAVRIEGGGDKLTSDMWFVHSGTRYDIKGQLGIDRGNGLVFYQVTVANV
jgi:hypothetical protein